MALTLWIFLISPLLAMSLCVVAKCCILTHKSWTDKYGKKSEVSESESDDDDLGFGKCRNNRRKTCNSGATRNKPQQKQKHAKIKADRRKSSKAPLLEPFNWDDLFPKHGSEHEAMYSAGATCSQSQDRRTSRDYLLSRTVINNYHGNRYGVFDKRKHIARSSYGCYTNYGRRLSNDPESGQDVVDTNRNRAARNGFSCHGDSSRQPTNRGASRRSGPSNHSNRRVSTNNRRPVPNSSNHSNTYEKATHVNLQTSDDIINSCVQRNNETTVALRYTVNLPPLNGVTTPQPNNSHYTNQVNLGNLYTSTFQLTSSCSSLASSYQQQCFCDSSLHISLRCRQCQANWLADPAWRSRRSLFAPSSSDSQESERALSIDSKMWHNPTPPPPYDEALNAPERIHRIELNNEGPPPYNSVYHLNTNTLPFSIATQAIQPDVIR